MADPITIAVGAAVAGGVASAAGAIATGRQQEAAYKYNADVNERNAQVQEQAAEQLVFIEEQKIADFREQFYDLQDAQSQAFRYNGWIAEEGTPLKVALASAQEAEEEIAIRRYNAKVGAQEAEERGVAFRMEGQLQRMYGSAAKRAGIIGAGTSLLSGFSRGAQIQAGA